MSKQTITEFDFENAFKALDELEVPKVKGLRPNRVNLGETFTRKLKTELLVEDYYDLGSNEDLDAATEDREAEVAQAKLARIEKIVDLDADSPEDLQPSYAGKIIIQCPNCMTLFYKDEADLEQSEEDETVVNVGEACQHCNNVDGYTVVGKVAPVEESELNNFAEEEPAEGEENLDLDLGEEEPAEEENTEENNEEDLDLDLNAEEEEVKEESLNKSKFLTKNESEFKSEELTLNEEVCPVCGDDVEEPCEDCKKEMENESLTEDIDKDLNKKLEEHNAYIAYLQAELDKAQKELENASNDFIKKSIEERIAAYQANLEAAIPEEVKNSTTEEIADEEVVDDIADIDAAAEEEKPAEEANEEEANESLNLSKFEKESEKKCNLKSKNDSKFYGLNESVVIEDEVEEGLGTLGAAALGAVAGVGAAHTADKLLGEEKTEEALVKNCPVNINLDAHELGGNGNDVNVLSPGKMLGEEKEESNICPDCGKEICECGKQLKEEDELLPDEPTEADYDELLNSKEMQTPISEEEVDALIKEAYNIEEAEDLDEEALDEHLNRYFTETYRNINNYKTTGCKFDSGRLIVEGLVSFKSGKEKATEFEFEANNRVLEGINKTISADKAFTLEYTVKDNNIITENINYKYNIGEKLVEGSTKLDEGPFQAGRLNRFGKDKNNADANKRFQIVRIDATGAHLDTMFKADKFTYKDAKKKIADLARVENEDTDEFAIIVPINNKNRTVVRYKAGKETVNKEKEILGQLKSATNLGMSTNSPSQETPSANAPETTQNNVETPAAQEQTTAEAPAEETAAPASNETSQAETANTSPEATETAQKKHTRMNNDIVKAIAGSGKDEVTGEFVQQLKTLKGTPGHQQRPQLTKIRKALYGEALEDAEDDYEEEI